MKNSFKISMLLCAMVVLFSSCAGEDLDDKDADLLNTKMLVYIDSEDLVGFWELSIMKANRAVDLNDDGNNSTNLKAETTCFDTMNINLRNDGTFSSVNARMDFQAGDTNDKFLCMTPRMDSGTWTVDGDVLTLKVNIGGEIYTHTKKLSMFNNTFSFDVNRIESQQYVKDPGKTLVSEINVVSLTYTRV